MQKTTVSVEEAGGKFTQAIQTGAHTLLSDEPRDVGGDDRGPTPYDLLLASLGACTSMTLRMYATRKEWPLEHVKVTLRHEKIHCADCDSKTGMIDNIEREIELVGDLSDDQRARLHEIADRCPVHRTLMSEKRIETTVVDS